MAVKIETTRSKMSVFGGVHLFENMIECLGMEKHLGESLPGYKIGTKTTSFEKFKAMVLGIVADANCLDDMDRLAEDPAFSAVLGHVNSSSTYGHYLRKFDGHHCRKLNEALIDNARMLRRALHPDCRDFTLYVDSTDHEQYGKNTEGVEFNYKHRRALDSIQAFDQFGLQYWMHVRPGNTFTANNSPEVIHTVFQRIRKHEAQEKIGRDRRSNFYLCADSGYCNRDTFIACDQEKARFVICMREPMYSPHIKEVRTWTKAKDVVFRDKRSCEIGTALYWPEGHHKALRLVYIRAQKPEWPKIIFSESRYDYHCWVTDIGAHEMTDEEIVLFYHKRGNAENFIREIKNGLDLHRFPCQRLMANRVYGLITAFAYNLMRYAGFILNMKHPHFAKATRFRMVRLAVQVVRHSRDVTLRFSHHQAREVKYWLTTIKLQLSEMGRAKFCHQDL